MTRGKPVYTLNDLALKEDKRINGEYYDAENETTGVIYMAYNLEEDKAYIGRVRSFQKRKKGGKLIRRGARNRFVRHWSNKDSDVAGEECPIFYDALRKSALEDWFIFTIAVYSLKSYKRAEAKLIRDCGTSDPEIGYNYFVGDNKPDNPEHLENYQSAKAESNVNRADDGAMRQSAKTKKLPKNINLRQTVRDGEVTAQSFFVQIKINKHLYNASFPFREANRQQKLDEAVAG